MAVFLDGAVRACVFGDALVLLARSVYWLRAGGCGAEYLGALGSLTLGVAGTIGDQTRLGIDELLGICLLATGAALSEVGCEIAVGVAHALAILRCTLTEHPPTLVSRELTVQVARCRATRAATASRRAAGCLRATSAGPVRRARHGGRAGYTTGARGVRTVGVGSAASGARLRIPRVTVGAEARSATRRDRQYP